MQNLKINISPTDRPQWHTPAEIRAAAAEDTRGECWTWYTDAGDYRSGDRVWLTFDGPAIIDATPAG